MKMLSVLPWCRTCNLYFSPNRDRLRPFEMKMLFQKDICCTFRLYSCNIIRGLLLSVLFGTCPAMTQTWLLTSDLFAHLIQVLQIKLHFWSPWLLPMGYYLQGYPLLIFFISLVSWHVDIFCSRFILWTEKQACGSKEEVRYLLWIRLTRALKVTEFFRDLEKDIRVNYLFTRIVKLIVVEIYCTHTAACIFYYLATTLPESMEGNTWIGSLKLGEYSYDHFRELDLIKLYTTSLYFAIVTMATVGKFWSHV